MKVYKFKESKNLIFLFQSLTNKNELEKYLLKEPKDKILAECYKIVKSQLFLENYKNLIKRIKKVLKYDFHYQRLPSVRISQPNDNENPFHIDLWSGHGQNIINFWIPIVDLNTYNTLYLVDEKNSNNLINQHVKKNFDKNKFQEDSFKYSKPILAKAGDIVVFSNKNVHGTIINQSKYTRLSIDFRILKIGEDPGTRDINKFYDSTELNFKKKLNKKNFVHAMLYSANSVSHISHISQRSVIDDYCSRKNLRVKEESSEMHGLDTYPNINFHIKNKKMPLVLFSTKCLPSTKSLFAQLLGKLRKYKYGIHFALEGKELNELTNHDILNMSK